MTDTYQDWRPFGIGDEEYPEPDVNGVRVVNLAPGKQDKPAKEPKNRAGTWLRNAMIALGLLALAAAVVSFEAQYRMVYAAKGVKVIALIEGGIPDALAMVFACLGIALALQGKRATRCRILNVAAVGTSIGMNYLASSGTSWKDAAIWVMPSIAYAVASDTAIGVIRAYEIARQKQPHDDLSDEDVTPLAVLGGLLLWVLRLSLAPRSTLAGFRSWVVESCPVAPGRRAEIPAPPVVLQLDAPKDPVKDEERAEEPKGKQPGRRGPRGPRADSKMSQFLALVREEYGDDLSVIDPAKTSEISRPIADAIHLDRGSARRDLRKAVVAARAAREAEDEEASR